MQNHPSGHRWVSRGALALSSLLAAAVCLGQCGCTGPVQWVRNGFKVGPNYGAPPVAVSGSWIDAADPKVVHGDPNLAAWWCIFDDPVLNDLIQRAYAQNLTVREAAARILQARAELGIARGEIMPQTQTANFSYSRNEISLTRAGLVPVGGGGSVGFGGPVRFFDNWSTGLNLAWEIDFWGKYRRAIESADAGLDASIADYDEVLVILLSDVASAYVELRTLQRRLELAEINVKQQERLVNKTMYPRWKAGIADSDPAYHQLKAQLEQTRALIPQLRIFMRRANNKLCVLMGIPPQDLNWESPNRIPDPYPNLFPSDKDKKSVQLVTPIPGPMNQGKVRYDVVVGIPGEALLRRPDVVAVERRMAAQCAQIGVAESDFYPQLSILGTIGLQSANFATLFNTLSWAGNIGPSLTWKILNYGRILNNVRLQDAKLQELAATYQKVVLNANQEAEDAMVGYLQSVVRAGDLIESARAAARAADYLNFQLDPGEKQVDYNRLFTALNFKVQQQDIAAQAVGDIALNLIQLYRALGGGWQVRMGAGCHDYHEPHMPEVEVGPQPKPVNGDKKKDEMKKDEMKKDEMKKNAATLPAPSAVGREGGPAATRQDGDGPRLIPGPTPPERIPTVPALRLGRPRQQT